MRDGNNAAHRLIYGPESLLLEEKNVLNINNSIHFPCLLNVKIKKILHKTVTKRCHVALL